MKFCPRESAPLQGKLSHYRWWGELDETEESLLHCCRAFRARTDALPDRHRIGVITHYGFILGLTGQAVPNAAIVADELGGDLAVEVEPLVRERCVFSCDIGTPRSELERLWPRLDFGHLEECWWGSDSV